MVDHRVASLLDRVQKAQDDVEALTSAYRARNTPSRTTPPPRSRIQDRPGINRPAAYLPGQDSFASSSSVTREQSMSQDSIRQKQAIDEGAELFQNVTNAISLIHPSGWRILYGKYQKYYSSELPFAHPLTFLPPSHGADVPSKSSVRPANVAPSYLATLLCLAFMALTIRHCPNDLRQIISTGELQAKNCIKLSSEFISPVKRWLESIQRENQSATLESIQIKLVMACYFWSIGDGIGARRLLKDAILDIGDVEMLYINSSKHTSHVLTSVAMVFEANLMGINFRNAAEQKRQDPERPEEAFRRTYWSCFILDVHFGMGESRNRLLDMSRPSPPLPSDEERFCKSLSSDPAMESLDQGSPQSCFLYQKNDTLGSSQPLHAVGDEACVGRAAIKVEPSASFLNQLQPNDQIPLCWYIRCLNLLSKITSWTLGRNREYEVYPPWDRRSTWDCLMNESLAINQSMIGRLELSPVNIYAHIHAPTAAQYVSMQVARLLCQILIHWESLPFLPVRHSFPRGSAALSIEFFRADVEAEGFWLNSAKAFFQAARDLLDLASDSGEGLCMLSNTFTAYASFVASFAEIYGRSFPWMDLEHRMSPREAAKRHPFVDYFLSRLSTRVAAQKSLQSYSQDTIVLLGAEWASTLENIEKYFDNFKSDYYSNVFSEPLWAAECVPMHPHPGKCLRDGGNGEGEEEYRLFQSKLRDFGRMFKDN